MCGTCWCCSLQAGRHVAQAALSRRDASETESEFVRTFHAPFKRYTARAPVPATMQPRLPGTH
jgi:hypothetical protein